MSKYENLLKSLAEEICAECGDYVLSEQPFCMSCGKPNKNFSVEAFVFHFPDKTPESFLIDCESGHRDMLEAVVTAGGSVTEKYCCWCGSKLPELSGENV